MKRRYEKAEANAAATTITQTATCGMKLGENLACQITSRTLKILLTGMRTYIYMRLSPRVLIHRNLFKVTKRFL